MIKSSVIRCALILSFSLTFSYFNNLDFVQAMEVEQSEEEDISYLKQYKQNIVAISSRSIEDWASLWENDIYPIQIKDLNLNTEEDLQLLHVWISTFHYYRYSKNRSINKYKELLLQAQNIFANTNKYTVIEEFLESVIKSCSLK